MKKRNIFFAFILIFVFILGACNIDGNAISVTFSNLTSKGSKDYTVAVGYQQENSYENKGTDIFVKSDVENTTLTIRKELEDELTIKLTEKDNFYSLTKLLSVSGGVDLKYNHYDKMVSFNVLIKSDKNCNLTLKAVVGNLSENEMVLLDEFDVSKEFNIFVEKNEK